MMSGVKLNEVILTGTNLSHAYILGEDSIDGANLKDAILEGTSLPENVKQITLGKEMKYEFRHAWHFKAESFLKIAKWSLAVSSASIFFQLFASTPESIAEIDMRLLILPSIIIPIIVSSIYIFVPSAMLFITFSPIFFLSWLGKSGKKR